MDETVKPIRCLIAEIPHLMLAEIVQFIIEESKNIEVVDRISSIKDLPGIMIRQPIDVLILGMENFILPQICIDLLDQFSNLLIVGLVDDGRKAVVYFGDVGNDDILRVINTLGIRGWDSVDEATTGQKHIGRSVR